MSTIPPYLRRAQSLLIVVLLLLSGAWARAQDAVLGPESRVAHVLHAETQHEPVGNPWPLDALTVQTFEFSDNLICFTANVNGRAGTFILDTGAPRLLLNNRGLSTEEAHSLGQGAGGSVRFDERFVESFILSGRQYEKFWGLDVDLRSVEERVQHRVDGFVGYDLLSKGELRIDYQEATFQLLTSERNPEHFGRAPDYELPFYLYDHLPVIIVKMGRRKLHLAIDTGSSINLLDKKYNKRTLATTSRIDIQGLDGHSQIVQKVVLKHSAALPASRTGEPKFALLDLSELQRTASSGRIDGILGSSYLSNFTVGIDYRRQRLYLWSHPKAK